MFGRTGTENSSHRASLSGASWRRILMMTCRCETSACEPFASATVEFIVINRKPRFAIKQAMLGWHAANLKTQHLPFQMLTAVWKFVQWLPRRRLPDRSAVCIPDSP